VTPGSWERDWRAAVIRSLDPWMKGSPEAGPSKRRKAQEFAKRPARGRAADVPDGNADDGACGGRYRFFLDGEFALDASARAPMRWLLSLAPSVGDCFSASSRTDAYTCAARLMVAP
jgi:hypothetical protein